MMENYSLSDVFNGDSRCILRTLLDQPAPNATCDINLPQSDLLKVKIEPCDASIETENCGDQLSSAEPWHEHPNDGNFVSWGVFPAEEHGPIKSEPVGEDELFINGQLMGDQGKVSSIKRDYSANESNMGEFPDTDETERCYSPLIGECGSPVIGELLNPLPDLLQPGQRIRCYFCGRQMMYSAKYREHANKCIERRKNLVCQCCGTTWLKLLKPLRYVKRKLQASGKKSFLFCNGCPHEFRQQPKANAKFLRTAVAKRLAPKAKGIMKRLKKEKLWNRSKLPTCKDKKQALQYLYLLRGKLLCQSDRSDPSDANLAALCDALEEGINKLAVRPPSPKQPSNPRIHPTNTLTSTFESRAIRSNLVLPNAIKQRKPPITTVMGDNRSDAASCYKDNAIAQLREIISQAPRQPPVPVRAMANNFRGSIAQRLEDVLSRRRQQINRHLEEEAIREGTVKPCSVLLVRLPPVANHKRVKVEDDNEFVVPCDFEPVYESKAKWVDGYGYFRARNSARDELWQEKRRKESLVRQRRLACMGKLVTSLRSTWISLSARPQRSNQQCSGSSRQPMPVSELTEKVRSTYVKTLPKYYHGKWPARSNYRGRKCALRLKRIFCARRYVVERDIAAGGTSFGILNSADCPVLKDVGVTMELILYSINRVYATNSGVTPACKARQSAFDQEGESGGRDNNVGEKKYKLTDNTCMKFSMKSLLRGYPRLYRSYCSEKSDARKQIRLEYQSVNSGVQIYGGRETALAPKSFDLSSDDVDIEVNELLKIVVKGVARALNIKNK